jgi:2'-5' RNA ligase superfamily
LRVPVDAASEQALKILSRFTAFEVELSTVGRFAETSFLYVDIGEGAKAFHKLHDALNQGDLAHAEEFQFRPHLTLGGPVPEAKMESSQDQAEVAWLGADHSRRFVLDEIVFLWLRSDDASGEWHRLWTYSLSTKGTALTKAAKAAFTNRTS